MQTSEELQTQVETMSPEETMTAEEMLTPEAAGRIEEDQTENMTEKREEAGTGQSAEGKAGTYLVRLRD